jgi:HSP20 family protein
MTTQEMARPTTGNTHGAHEAPRSGGSTYRPNVDIRETAEELLIEAEMPGTSAENIEVKFEDGTLSILGRVQQRQPSNVEHLLREYGVGDFYREFRVNEQVNVTGIRAEYREGVLTLHLPKVEAIKPRKIEVQAK